MSDQNQPTYYALPEETVNEMLNFLKTDRTVSLFTKVSQALKINNLTVQKDEVEAPKAE